jgi:hypothetical protein
MAVTFRYRPQLFQISSAGGVISNVCTTTTYRGLPGFLVPHETVSALAANAPRLRLHESPVRVSTQVSGSPLLCILPCTSVIMTKHVVATTYRIHRSYIHTIHSTQITYMFSSKFSTIPIFIAHRPTIQAYKLETSSSCIYILTFI